MAKPNKESIITDILIELNGVNNQCSKILEKLRNKYNLSDRTFHRRWKEANERHKIAQLEQQKKISEGPIKVSQKTIRAINKKLLDIINNITIVEEKAYDMQLGKVVVYNREPNPMEIIEAIKEYNRINGL